MLVFINSCVFFLQLKELQTRQAALLTLQRDAEIRLAEAEEEVCQNKVWKLIKEELTESGLLEDISLILQIMNSSTVHERSKT